VTDVFTDAKRSEVMSRIRGKGNKATELALIRVFRAHKITGWRRHQTLFGRPDFVFPKLRIALFVDGCFWHACPLHSTQPKINAAFWEAKLSANKVRDQLVTNTLTQKKWCVLRIWEHELLKNNQSRLLRRLMQSLGDGPRKVRQESRI
jgi:DNA mismatch endonuclease, patch repair protein